MIDHLFMHRPPVIQNAENSHVFVPDVSYRSEDVTNIVDHSYEYSQPKSFRLTTASNFQVNNPFNTPSQFALLYATVSDAASLLALTIDNNDTSTLPTANNITDFPGYLLSQTGTAPLSPALAWIDFQQFVQVRASGITTFLEFCLLFRRKREQIIPRNITPFNDPSQ